MDGRQYISPPVQGDPFSTCKHFWLGNLSHYLLPKTKYENLSAKFFFEFYFINFF